MLIKPSEFGYYLVQIIECMKINIRRGDGIEKEDRKKILQNYYQAASKCNTEKNGMGLGLAIVSNLVKAHQGEIIIDNKQNKGTEIVIRLPIENEEYL